MHVDEVNGVASGQIAVARQRTRSETECPGMVGLGTRWATLATTGNSFVTRRSTQCYGFWSVPSAGAIQASWHWSRYPFSCGEKPCGVSVHAHAGSFRKMKRRSSACSTWKVTNQLSGSRPNGDVFLDIGAFVGWHSIRAGRVVGPSGRVVWAGLEAGPRQFGKQLDANLAMNGIANCKTIPLASLVEVRRRTSGRYTRSRLIAASG